MFAAGGFMGYENPRVEGLPGHSPIPANMFDHLDLPGLDQIDIDNQQDQGLGVAAGGGHQLPFGVPGVAAGGGHQLLHFGVPNVAAAGNHPPLHDVVADRIRLEDYGRKGRAATNDNSPGFVDDYNAGLPSAGLPNTIKLFGSDPRGLGVVVKDAAVATNFIPTEAIDRLLALLPNRVCMTCHPKGRKGDPVRGTFHCVIHRGDSQGLAADAHKWLMLDFDHKCYEVKAE